MPRARTLALQAFALLTCLATVHGLYVHFDVQQALAGDDFGSAGSISGDLAENSQLLGKLTWERPTTTATQKQQFAEAVKHNRYIRVRVPSDPEDASSAPVLGAVPARCLAASGNDEQLRLHLSAAGQIVSVEYRAKCGQSASQLSATGWSPAQSVEVISQYPEPVQPLRVSHSTGFDPSGSPAGSAAFSDPQQVAEAGPEGKEGAKKTPPKDERPWWQKNWIFLIPAGMLLVNLLGGQAEPAQAGRAGPGAAGAAASAVASRPRRGR